eukprot:3583040-Pleurochrysis_carterae.AAC.2
MQSRVDPLSSLTNFAVICINPQSNVLILVSYLGPIWRRVAWPRAAARAATAAHSVAATPCSLCA